MKVILCIMSILCLGYYSEKKEMVNVQEVEINPTLIVTVEGAVVKEGNYTFDKQMTIEEMLKNVGVLENADLSLIPLYQMIEPEKLIYVPFKKEGRISLNNASLEELQTIKGIGPKKAQAVIDGRPYTCLEDMMKVKGIGLATYRKWRELFCL